MHHQNHLLKRQSNQVFDWDGNQSRAMTNTFQPSGLHGPMREPKDAILIESWSIGTLGAPQCSLGPPWPYLAVLRWFQNHTCGIMHCRGLKWGFVHAMHVPSSLCYLTGPPICVLILPVFFLYLQTNAYFFKYQS